MPPNGEHASNLEVCYKIYDSYAKDMTPIMLDCASYCKVPPQFMRGVILPLITPHKKLAPSTTHGPVHVTYINATTHAFFEPRVCTLVLFKKN